MGQHHEGTRANSDGPVTNIVTYLPKPGKEAELLALVKKHEPALRSVGLVTAQPFKVWKAFDIRKQRVSFIEQFEWKDGKSSDVAHQTPEVMAVWEPMGAVLEELTLCEVEPV
jgi:quinol monooxygenase YgiN